VCPIHLQPFLLADYAQHKRWEDCDELHALDCIECGSCSFICPAKRTLVSSIRVGKRQVQAERKKKAVKKNG
jgi:electron transport complex protein RnfC